MAEMYRSAMTLDNFGLAATVVCNAGQYTKLGEYKVQAGELVEWGFGAQSGMDNAVGRIYGILKDNAGTPVEIKGKLRVSIHSPQNRPMMIIDEYRTEVLNTSTDRTKQTPLAESNIRASEDKKIVIELMPDATATLSKANSTLIADITQYVV